MVQSLKCTINQTILDSCVKAAKSYYDISQGWPLDTPEYWYNVAVVKALASKKYEQVAAISLEESTKSIRANANGMTGNSSKMGRPHKDWRSKGRADIVIWGKPKAEEWIPKAIIELKRGHLGGIKKFSTDLDRICISLKETGHKSGHGSIEFGVLVIFSDLCSQASKKDAEKAMENEFAKFKEIVKNHLEAKGKFKQSANYAHGAFKKDDNGRMAIIFVVRIEKK